MVGGAREAVCKFRTHDKCHKILKGILRKLEISVLGGGRGAGGEEGAGGRRGAGGGEWAGGEGQGKERGRREGGGKGRVFPPRENLKCLRASSRGV